MRQILNSILFAGVGTLMLLASAVVLAPPFGLLWLSEWFFYPGDHLYPWFRRSGMLEVSELLHHQFVLLASLLSWWVFLAICMYLLKRLIHRT
jgi:hypothetical protein